MPDNQLNSIAPPSLTPQQVSRVSQRFVALHQARLLRILNGLSPQAQKLIVHLPLLWGQHGHQSDLTHDDNHSIRNPSDDTQNALSKTIFTQKASVNFAGWPQTIDKNLESVFESLFEGAPPTSSRDHNLGNLYPIHQGYNAASSWLCSLWIESETGTLKRTSRPSATVYLVSERALSSVEQALWEQKAEALERWAISFGLSLRHRCIYVSSVASPSSLETLDTFQRDHFYAKSIWLAGKTALWWFIPPQLEHNYEAAAPLIEKQLQLMQVGSIDLGHVQPFTPLELLEAMCLCLEKSFQQPLDALFQISLLETYTQDQDGIASTLSHHLKDMIYQDHELESLSEYTWDIHWLWNQCLEQYWQPKGQIRFLDWLRKHWHNWLHEQNAYYSVNPIPEQGVASTPPPYDVREVQAFWMTYYQRWKWPTHDGIALIKTPDVGLSRWVHERETLSNAFLKCYRRISDNLFKHLPTNAPEVTEWQRLGRKLLATYEIRSGKIIQLEIPEKNRENIRHLYLQFKNEDGITPTWRVFAIQSPNQRPHPAMLWYQSAQLHELLCWCYFNQLLSPTLQWQVEDSDEHQITPQLLQLWLQQFRSHLPLPLFKPRTEAFDQPALMQHLVVMVDLGTLSDKALVRIDVTTHNSWNEVTTRSFSKNNTPYPLAQFMVWLAETLRNNRVAQAFEQKHAPPKIHVLSTQFTQSPWQRLIEYFTQTLCTNNGLHTIEFSSPRFLWQDESGFQLLYTKGDNQPFRHHCFADQSQLLKGLELSDFSQGALHWLETPSWFNHLQKKLPSTCTENAFSLRCVFSRGAAKGIQILFKPTGKHHAQLFCWDHQHGLFMDSVSFRSTKSLIRSLHVFIRSLMDRLDLPDQSTQWGLGRYPIECWEINENDITLCEEPFELADIYAFRIQAVLTSNHPDQSEWRFYCDQQPMGSTLDLHTQLHSVAQFILSRRHNAEPYPCYITDVDLSILPTEARTLSEHLRQKLLLEAKLNEAIRDIYAIT